MSQAENQSGWKPSAKLRSGQQRLFELLQAEQKRQYSIKLPTGYGKSWCACIAYAVMRSQQRVNRMLIIVPTDQQRSQYVDGLREDLAILEIKYSEIERCDNQASWVIKKSHRNESEIFVTTAASISSGSGYYADLMSKGSWLVVADEFHHYAEGNTWGKALNGLEYEAILGMSATPLRRDKTSTIFGDRHFDIEVGIEDAFEEGAVKKIEARIGDYSISWSSVDDPEPHSCLTSELEEEFRQSGESRFSEFEIKQGIRYYDKYISEIFLQVLSAWSDYDLRWPEQNQILIFAMSCRHAEMITQIVNACAYPGFPEPFADWIGVSDNVDDPRSDKRNQEILERFQRNELPCLVQVNKAGEGFNNKRCSIGLFLDLVGPTPMKQQHIGRFMRVNPQAPDQASLIFISSDSPCRGLLEGIEEEFGPRDEGNGKEEGSSEAGKEREIRIPDIILLDTEFHSERVVYPFGSAEKTLDHILENHASNAIRAACGEMDRDALTQFFRDSIQGLLPTPKRFTSEQLRDQVKKQVARNTGLLVSAIIRKRYGATFPKTAKGDFYKLINSRWKKANSAHAEMTEQDLRDKNKWLQELAHQVNQGKTPTWLNL